MLIVKLAIIEASALADLVTQEIPIMKGAGQVCIVNFKNFCRLFHNFFKLVPEPVIDEPEDCRIDVDCPALEICYTSGGKNRCVDPCSTIAPCVVNAACKVYSTTPTRTMTCICFEGYTGNGIVSCDKISKQFNLLRKESIGKHVYFL